MNYLIDTNVVSELAKSRPDARVVKWIAEADEDRVCLSVITFAEIRHGIEEMAPGQRREVLKLWLEEELTSRFDGRIFAVGLAVAQAWGVLVARAREKGVTIGVMDAFLAATAEAHGLTLVTRNTRHFEKLGLALVNPWIAAANNPE